MTFQTGSIDKNGLARTEDGKLYVTAVGNAAITSGTSKWNDGTASAPSIAFASETTTGFFLPAAGTLGVALGSAARMVWTSSTVGLRPEMIVGWTAGAATAAQDTTLSRQAAGRVAVMAATATPAGGSASLALVFGSTSGFGIYIGSGAPSVSAAQGSLYLRSDGSSTSTRAYINNSSGSGTTWTAITTAA